MTREEFKRKYDDISDRQKEQLRKFIQEKEELFNTYKNDENCPFRVGDFYISKITGDILRIMDVKIIIDGYVDNVDYSEFEIYFEYLNGKFYGNNRGDWIMDRYIKTDEDQINKKKEEENLLREMAIKQTRAWEALKEDNGFIENYTLWELGYKQAMEDLENRQ